MNLCVHFGWTRVAIISSTDDYGSGLAQTISTTAVQSGVTILANIAIDITQSEMDSGMQAIKDSGALILIVVTETTSLPAILSSMQNTDYKPNAVVASDFLLSEGMAYLVETTGWPAVRPLAPLIVTSPLYLYLILDTNLSSFVIGIMEWLDFY